MVPFTRHRPAAPERQRPERAGSALLGQERLHADDLYPQQDADRGAAVSDKVMIWLLFEQDEAFLLTRRKPDEPPFAGYWTLPGDMMRFDESASETVKRFGQNELNVQISAEEFVDTFYIEENNDRY